jgi:hypothetical protein
MVIEVNRFQAIFLLVHYRFSRLWSNPKTKGFIIGYFFARFCPAP